MKQNIFKLIEGTLWYCLWIKYNKKMPPKKTTTTRTPAKPAAKSGAAKSTAKPAAKKPAASKKAAAPKNEKAAAAEPLPELEVKQEKEEKPKVLPGVSIGLKQLNTVLMGDEDGKIKDSGRWPVVIDQGGVAQRFLRHRDVNYLEALDQNHMEAERIRLALLGGIRFGKPLVLDLYDVDVFESVEKFFDNVEPGLLKKVMDKSILKEENYKNLIKDTDDESYTTLWQYTDDCIERFALWILTMKADPEKALMEQVYPIRIE